jgi:Domain of Unknown Function (DUF1080)
MHQKFEIFCTFNNQSKTKPANKTMRQHLNKTLVFLLFFTVLLACTKKSAETSWVTLFNGQDLTGWDTYLGPAYDSLQQRFDSLATYGLNNDPKGVFRVVQEEGSPAIRISGEGFGGISTLNEYENYHLRVEFKWGQHKFHPRKQSKRDSGILYHGVGPQGAGYGNWLRSQEFQVQEGDCGDYWSIDNSMVDIPAAEPEPGRYVYDSTASLRQFSFASESEKRCIKNPDAEKASGEWNTVDIYCFGDKSIHMINGVVVMKLFNSRHLLDGKPVPLTKGKIQIQTEGAEVYYRNIQLAPISETDFNRI